MDGAPAGGPLTSKPMAETEQFLTALQLAPRLGPMGSKVTEETDNLLAIVENIPPPPRKHVAYMSKFEFDEALRTRDLRTVQVYMAGPSRRGRQTIESLFDSIERDQLNSTNDVRIAYIARRLATLSRPYVDPRNEFHGSFFSTLLDRPDLENRVFSK